MRDRERAAPVCFAGWLAVARSLCAEGTARLPRPPAGDPRQPRSPEGRGSGASVITAVPLCELPGTRACTAPADRRALPESLGQDLTALGGPAPCPPAWCLLRQHAEEEGSSTRHPGERARPGVSLGLAMMPALVVPGSRSQSRASSIGASPTCVSRRLCLCESVCARVCTCMYMCLCVPKCACVYLSVCVSVCMCVCVSVCFVGVG